MAKTARMTAVKRVMRAGVELGLTLKSCTVQGESITVHFGNGEDWEIPTENALDRELKEFEARHG